MDYAERLHVPLRWWVQGTMLVASLWLAVVVALPAAVAWAVTATAMLLLAWAFIAYGAARVAVSAGEFHAGRAHIDTRHVGEVTALDAARTRQLAGAEADARAYLLLRPYLKRGVRVEITDPADRTPYWLVHTRRPDRLAEALVAAAAADRSTR